MTHVSRQGCGTGNWACTYVVTGNIIDSVSIYAQEYLNAKTNLKFVTSSIYLDAELQNLGAHKRKNSFSSNKAQV